MSREMSSQISCNKLDIQVAKGNYLGHDELLFIENFKNEIEQFVEKLESNSVLVFPPFLSRYRFLAHKAIDDYFFPQLCSFSIGYELHRRIVVGSTLVIAKCCLPYKCVHEKSYKSSKVVEKRVDCICPARLKLLNFSPIKVCKMPSSMKLEHPINAKSGLQSTERKQNRSSVSDRQKRPDMQIYVPRALRGAQKKCIPSESESGSIEKNYQKALDKPLSLENELDKYADVSQPKNAEMIIDSSHTTIPQTSTTDDFIFIKSECFDTTNLLSDGLFTPSQLSDKQIASCQISESFNCSSEEQMDSSQICESLNICSIPNEQIGSSEISKSLNQSLSDEKISSPVVIEKQSCTSTLDINLLDNSSKTSEISSPLITKTSIILLVNDKSESPCQGGSLSNKISSKRIWLDSSDNSSEVSTEIDASESFADTSNECVFQEKDDSWESKFDDDGECLNPEFLKDLKNITGEIEVLVAKNNYKGFVQESSGDGYDCIIELYGFPIEFNTQDLVSAFSQFQQANYSIKWVDDCHALAIFSSPSLANQALLMNHPFVKTRPISEGIKESQEKAKWCTRYSEPVKPRPTTSAALARRLVSGALGLKVHASKEQREQERTILREAKEKRKLKAKQKQAIWDGVVL
ncbi:hypothetical protein JTE90_017982 [Oedothorax gibbosus]|uniref:R3H domain-containing protein n=1 Tax=Oedothorax gibbosus TaxID=931172 RepID=A0AAV6V895_9ARAC|nr:hypothetical protein JTE90_017982 [Oedothorax gibbosus]